MAANKFDRICIATSYSAAVEPRAPRYAAAIARMCPNTEVLFVDCVPAGAQSPEVTDFASLANVRRHTVRFAWRGGRRLTLAAEKAYQVLSQTRFSLTGRPSTAAFSTRSIELRRYLLGTKANLYGGFNIDALLPVSSAARKYRVPWFFDCQEYYSDMSHEQSENERAMIRTAEREFLPHCNLVLAATPQIAGRLELDYGLKGVLPLDNAPPLDPGPFPPPSGQFSLYWRNGVLDLGGRGLEQVFRAMALLPEEIVLYIQGRLPRDGAGRGEALMRELGIQNRVVTLPPYAPNQAIQMAAPHLIGLCPEQLIGENLNLTSSNKLFDYMMAGLAIVASDTAGLRDVIRRSRAGLLFPAGDPGAMADCIQRLYANRGELADLRQRARAFAQAEGNLEFQVARLRDALDARVFGPAGVELAPEGRPQSA